MQLVDSHCHPYFSQLAADIEAVLSRAKAAGVGRMIAVGTTLADSQQAIALAQRYEGIWAAAGIHPHEAAAFNASKTALDTLKEILNKSRIVAIGEIGLDYYKNYAAKGEQITALRRQIEATIDLGLPYIFHIRDAWADFWPIFDDYPNLRGVVHSFTADQSELEQVLKRDLFVSLNGIMTFTKDQQQLAAAKTAPRSKLLLETDAPFLTPAPYRGRTCEPAHLAVTAKFLAELRDELLDDLASITSANAVKLFGLEKAA